MLRDEGVGFGRGDHAQSVSRRVLTDGAR